MWGSETIHKYLNYKTGYLALITKYNMYIFNSTTGAVLYSKGLTSNYQMLGIVYEYDWNNDSIYVLYGKTDYTETLRIEEHNIVTQASTKQNNFNLDASVIGKFGKIGSDVDKTMVLATTTSIYSMDPHMQVQYSYSITALGYFNNFDIHLGTYSYVVGISQKYIFRLI